MNLHLLSFGGPTEKYSWTLDRLKKESQYIKVFKSINIFTEKNIFDYCPELNQHKIFMQSSRGYGYWIWKYYLISKLFEQISSNSIVLYLDAGCTINECGLERLSFYYKMAEKNDIVAFQMKHLEKQYTKMDTYLRIFKEDFSHYETGQIHASSFLIKKSTKTKEFIEKIKTICIEKNYHYIDDSNSIVKNHTSFISHRHDQSIFSLMCKKDNAYLIEDETYWEPNWNLTGKNYPIWVTRIR